MQVAYKGKCRSDCNALAPISVTYGSWKTPDCVAEYNCTNGKTPNGDDCICPNPACEECTVKTTGTVCQKCDDTKFLIDGQCFKAAECRGTSIYRKGIKKEGLKCTCALVSKRCSRCDMMKKGNETKYSCLGCRKAKYFHLGECLDNCPAGLSEYGMHGDYGRKCKWATEPCICVWSIWFSCILASPDIFPLMLVGTGREPFSCVGKKIRTGTLVGKKCRCPDKVCYL